VEAFVDSDMLDSDSLQGGDAVFVVGFPLGMVGLGLTPIVRGGVVALPAQGKDKFIADAHVYPGNSGGPVVTAPDIYNYRTNEIGLTTKPRLVGVVSGYVAYKDIAVSLQTRRPRVTFEENSGLSEVMSTRALLRLISRYR
jgi:hypothetical protein